MGARALAQKGELCGRCRRRESCPCRRLLRDEGIDSMVAIHGMASISAGAENGPCEAKHEVAAGGKQENITP